MHTFHRSDQVFQPCIWYNGQKEIFQVQYHRYSIHLFQNISNHYQSEMLVGIVFGKNYTLKQLEIDLSEKNDEKEYPLKKQKIDIWEHLTNLWRSNFTIEEYEQFSSNFSVMRTYDSCRITYKKDTIDTDEGLIGQIYHSAKLMDDRFILSLSGSLVGDQNPRVLESITQLNINVKSQYWFNVFLWKMQNRDKYNQDTREALKSFREACLKEKQHQYLCTYYMIFQKILENNGIIYLHNSNSRKTAKNIVEDQQFLKDGYIEGHSSKDFVQFSIIDVSTLTSIGTRKTTTVPAPIIHPFGSMPVIRPSRRSGDV